MKSKKGEEKGLGNLEKGRGIVAIDITKREDIALEFHDGYARTEVLKGVYPLVKTYKCLLKAGHTAEPERYSDKIQVFSFTSGTGYICG